MLQWFWSRWRNPPKDPKGGLYGPLSKDEQRHLGVCAIFSGTTVNGFVSTLHGVSMGVKPGPERDIGAQRSGRDLSGATRTKTRTK